MTAERDLEHARNAAARLLTAAAKSRALARSGRELAREEMLRALQCSHFDSDAAAQAIELAWRGDKEARIALHTAIVSYMAIDHPDPGGFPSLTLFVYSTRANRQE